MMFAHGWASPFLTPGAAKPAPTPCCATTRPEELALNTRKRATVSELSGASCMDSSWRVGEARAIRLGERVLRLEVCAVRRAGLHERSGSASSRRNLTPDATSVNSLRERLGASGVSFLRRWGGRESASSEKVACLART